MEGYERKNKEEIHKELQDIDPIGSHHLEEKVIGGNEDLDLLFRFPQKDGKNMGDWRREGKLSRSTKREAKKHGWLKEKEGVFIGGENLAVGRCPKRRLAVSPAAPDFRLDCPAASPAATKSCSVTWFSAPPDFLA
jgi:hypothetical protein